MLKETKLGTKTTSYLKLRVMLQTINLSLHLCYRNNSIIILSMFVGIVEVYFKNKQIRKSNLFKPSSLLTNWGPLDE